MATHSSIIAWKILWTEEPGGLQPIGPQSQTQQSSSHFHSLFFLQPDSIFFSFFFFFFASFSLKLAYVQILNSNLSTDNSFI